MERLSSFGLFFTLLTFSLSSASASTEDLRSSHEGFLSNNLLDEGRSYGDHNNDGLEQSQPAGGVSPQEIMDKIFGIMKQLQDAQNQEPTEVNDTPISSGPPSVDSNAINSNNRESSLNVPNPTPDTPTSNETNTEDIWIKTKKKTHFELQVYRKGPNGTSVNKFTTPEIHDKSDTGLHNHLKSLFESSVPVIVKDNQASVHPDVNFSDMSKVFPDLPTLMQKLHEVHKPGHVSIVIIKPNHLPVNKMVVQHTKICCQMRHILIQSAQNHDEPQPESSSWLDDFLDHLAQHHSNEVETEPAEEDHHDDEVSEGPWNPEEQNVVKRIMDNLHLFDSPGHLSAISFNPRHISLQKKNPRMIHIRVRIEIPPWHRSDDSKLENPYSNENTNENNNEHSFAYGDHNAGDTPEQFAEPASDLLRQSQIPVGRIHHSGTRFMHIPLHHLLDSFQDEEPASTHEQTTHHFRKPIMYFIHHRHLDASPIEPQQSSNIRSFLNDIFHIPIQGVLPSEEIEPHSQEDMPQESFHNIQSGEKPSLQDFFSGVEHSSDASSASDSGEDSRPRVLNFPSTSSEGRLPSFQSKAEEPNGSEQFSPLGMFKIFNMNGEQLSPNSFSQGGDLEEPSKEEVPSHRVRIIRFRLQPSGDDAFNSLG